MADKEAGKVHSMLGPSSMHRTLNCAGSNNLIRKIGDKARKSGIDAAHGSAAHELLATCLYGGEDAWEHQGELIQADKDFPPFVVDQEMIDGVQMAIDWTRDKMAKFPGAILLVERGVASPADPDAFGTSDIIIIVPGQRLIVGDFKYGKGIVVEPDDEQLRAYGQYSFETFVRYGDILTGKEYEACDAAGELGNEVFPSTTTVCELYIIQPRVPGHEKGYIRRHVTNRQELSRWFYGEVLPGFEATRDPNAPLTMGSWCNFCPAADFCPALRRGLEDYNISIEPTAQTDEQLNAALVKGEQVLKQHARNQKEAFMRAMKGSKFEDWKLVRQQGTRVWKPGAEAEVATLGPAAYTDPELKSPPQIEKLGT